MASDPELSSSDESVSAVETRDGWIDVRIDTLIERIDATSFDDWYRKIYYRQLNAPEEQADPQGIFWSGTKFEEELVVPYLEATVGSGEYVRNSMWIDATCETDAGEVRIKGATDPVIVDAESEPLLLTESKTKSSVDNLDEPNTHHRAQVHAYMYGLTQKHDRQVTDAVLLYGSRNSLDVQAFHVSFDPWFWRETVLNWAEEHTQYRLNETLPPATPVFDWECEFCDFKNRCGQGDTTPFADTDPAGLLPLFDAYPREKVADYLDTEPEAKLTPALAHKYPALAESYGIYDWHCDVCGTEVRIAGGIGDLWSFAFESTQGMTLELVDGSEHFLCFDCIERLPEDGEPTAEDVASLRGTVEPAEGADDGGASWPWSG